MIKLESSNHVPSLIRVRRWQLASVLVLMAAGIGAAFLARGRILPFVAGAFLVLCGTLLWLLWRVAVSAHERFQETKWDQANRSMSEFMQVLIDIMPNPAFFKDVEGRYRGTNPAFEKLLGKSKSELIGRTIG